MKRVMGKGTMALILGIMVCLAICGAGLATAEGPLALDSEHVYEGMNAPYADGYRRNPAPGTCMCINGTRVPVIGRVAMQMTCVDLTDLPCPPAPGDVVHILGGPGNAVSAQELAGWWGTIPYEVTCLLGKNRRD